MVDETEIKRRFLLYSLVRLGGLTIFFFGLAIAYTDAVREGGWPRLGLVIAVLGAIDALIAPMILKRSWDKGDK